MAGKRVYTDEDRALVKMHLDAHDGAIKPTARDAGIPIATVRDWKRKWEREGVPETIQDALPAVRDDFVDKAIALRDKALAVADSKLDADRTTAKDAMWIAAVLVDKIRLVQGQATSRTETASVGSLPTEELRVLLAGFAQGIVDAAKERSTEISSTFDGEEPIEEGSWEPAHQHALTVVAS